MCVAAAVIEQSLNLQTALGQPGQSLKNPTGFLGIRLIGQLSMAGDSAVIDIKAALGAQPIFIVRIFNLEKASNWRSSQPARPGLTTILFVRLNR
jgi:hypothetical protein